MKFAEKEADLRTFLETVPVARLSIDQNGIGMPMVESLSIDYPGVVVGEVFSASNKEWWVTNYKVLLQKKNVSLPGDRDLVAQTHSIKRTVSLSGTVSFTSKQAGKGHFDWFWAVAIACRKEREVSGGGSEITALVLG